MLTDYFINKYTALLKKRVVGFESDVWDFLYKYHWPGNVRELENTVEYMVNMLDNNGVISSRLLPQKIQTRLDNNSYLIPLEEMERDLIKRSLNVYGNNVKGKQQAADALGIGIATLYRKIKKYGLE